MISKKQITLVVTTILLIGMFGIFVSAENVVYLDQKVSPATAFFNNLFHTLGAQPFSVVGDNQVCGNTGGTPSHEWSSVSQGATTTIKASNYCLSGHGMIDTFSNGWTAWAEYKDSLTITCGTGPCNYQLYCCPNPEPNCASPTACASSKSCKTVSCTQMSKTTSSGGLAYFFWCPGESRIPYALSTYSYCSTLTKTCWYKEAGVCKSRDYSITNFPNACTTYSYEGKPLFNYESSCQASTSCSVNSECSSGKICTAGTCVSASTTCTPQWDCTSWSDCTSSGFHSRTCNDLNDCGTTSGIPLTTESCTFNPDGCSPNCAGKSCGEDNGCGGICNSAILCGASAYCGDGQCNGDETCSSCSDCGDCSSNDNSALNVAVSNIVLPNSKATSTGDPATKEYAFKVTLQNNEDRAVTVKVEAGFYTQDYAKNEAKLFSIFPMFAAVSPIDNCVSNEPFLKTIEVQLKAGEKKTVEIDQAPLNAYVTLPINNEYILKDVKLVSFLGVMQHEGGNACCKKLPGFTGCAEGTGGYIDSKYDPTFYIPEQTALGKDEITCNGKVYGVIDWNFLQSDKITILKDYTGCIDYTFYTVNGTVNETATADYKAAAEAGELSQTFKLSLTKDEIKIATTPTLLASACKNSAECLPKIANSDNKTIDYDISCPSVQSLRNEGTLSEPQKKDFLSEGKKMVSSGIVGGTIGGLAGIALCYMGSAAVAAAAAGPTLGVGAALVIPGFTTCAAVGAAIGAGAGLSQQIIVNGIKQDDALVAALNAGDANGIGICTATPKPTTVDITAFLDKIGAIIKITGNQTIDGIIVIVAGILLLMFIFNSSKGGKK